MQVETDESRRNTVAVVWFCVLTLVLSWGAWSLLWVLDLRFPSMFDAQTLPPMLYKITLAGALMPAASALIVTKFVLGESWRTTTIDRLGSKRFYLWALLLPLIITAATGALLIALGTARFDPDFTTARMGAAQRGWKLPPNESLLPWILIFMVINLAARAPLGTPISLGEELGWRGFLLPRWIAAGFGQWPALILSGAFFGFWHTPLILRGLNFPERPYLGVVLMVAGTTLIGILYGWLFLESGSVWVAAFAHSAWDSVTAYPFLLTTLPLNVRVLPSIAEWLPMILFIAWLIQTDRLPVRSPAASTDTSACQS